MGNGPSFNDNSARHRVPNAPCVCVRPTAANAAGKGRCVIRDRITSVQTRTARTLLMAPSIESSLAFSKRRRASNFNPAKTCVSRGCSICVMPAGMKCTFRPFAAHVRITLSVRCVGQASMVRMHQHVSRRGANVRPRSCTHSARQLAFAHAVLRRHRYTQEPAQACAASEKSSLFKVR